MRSDDVLSDALKLSPRDRAALIDVLLQSLDQPDAALDGVWADEALARLAAVRSGAMPTFEAEIALAPR